MLLSLGQSKFEPQPGRSKYNIYGIGPSVKQFLLQRKIYLWSDWGPGTGLQCNVPKRKFDFQLTYRVELHVSVGMEGVRPPCS